MIDNGFVSGGSKGDGRNLFVMATATNGTYVDQHGEEKPNNKPGNERSSDYIKAHTGEVFSVTAKGTAYGNTGLAVWTNMAWYDSNKSYIKSEGKNTLKDTGATVVYDESFTFTAPPNAAYLRVSARFYDDGRIKVERGSTPTDWTPAPEDIVTKTPPDIFDALDSIPEMHRNIFRGKNLGTVFTDEQKAAIADGSFHDLWVGDYWVINSHTWRIVDINYWYGTGNINCITPHVVIMPDRTLYLYKMNEAATTEDGYTGSDLYKNGLDSAKKIVNTDFGNEFVLNHRVLLSSKVVSGRVSNKIWVDSTVEIPNEIMMVGCYISSSQITDGSGNYDTAEIDKTQLALMRLSTHYICPSRESFWLRDICSDNMFARISESGYDSWVIANNEYQGVRPVFGITGETASADEPDSDLEITSLSTKGGEPL